MRVIRQDVALKRCEDDPWKRAFIHSLPTVDAMPVVHGRWERCFEDWRHQFEGDKCTACGLEHYGSSIDRYHYCPNCGAKMDLDKEE